MSQGTVPVASYTTKPARSLFGHLARGGRGCRRQGDDNGDGAVRVEAAGRLHDHFADGWMLVRIHDQRLVSGTLHELRLAFGKFGDERFAEESGHLFFRGKASLSARAENLPRISLYH